MKPYLYLVKYTITFESGHKAQKSCQIVASSKMNACAKIGQNYSGVMHDNEIDILSVEVID